MADALGAQFEQALEDVEQKCDAVVGSAFRSMASAGQFPPAPARGSSGDVEEWHRAFDWAAEQAETVADPACSHAPSSLVAASDRPDDIALELGLADCGDVGELNRRWRRFVLANHPDCRTDLAADLATRRVAIANGLVVEARRRFRAFNAAGG